ARVLGDRDRLRLTQIGVVGHVPVRQHHQMARVVGVEVEDGENQLSPRHDQGLAVRLARLQQPAERATVAIAPVGLVLPLDVGHPVRSPQPLQRVRHSGTVLFGQLHALWAALLVHANSAWKFSAVGEAFSLRCTHLVMAATASSTATPFIWVPSRNRKDTALFSTSRFPASSMNGTFCVVWVRIFFCIRSSLVSTSARKPATRSALVTFCRCSTCSSAIGIPITCTGDNHAGNAPA